MSGVYPLGTVVKVTETFTISGTPTDPTTVVYTVQDPLGEEVGYIFGVDAEVTNPGVGIYVLTLDPAALVGIWRWRINGSGAVFASNNGFFQITQDQLDFQTAPFPQFGPCQAWIDCNDITAVCEVTDEQLPLLDGIALQASNLMFEISGRQFSGRCPHTVRPCTGDTYNENSCWSTFPWNSWSGWPWAWGWYGGGWGWYDGSGICHCDCQAVPHVLLSGYPVVEITEVKIDGVVLPATRVNGSPNYQLEEWQRLVRMRDPDDPGTPVLWPSCQDRTLNSDQPGTWSVSYLSGIAPPQAGKAAAVALACELLPGGECKLPEGARTIVRQGLTITRIQPLAQMLLRGETGIVQIDSFLAAYNPSRLRRRPTIWAPGGPTYARPGR
jgi:hypothetical protein